MSIMRTALLLTALLLLTACSHNPAFSPIPAQAPPVIAPDPPSVPCFFSMSEARADQAIVQDIPLGLGSGVHRWTAENPAVRCKLPSGGPWNIAMDFFVTGTTMRDTGPITLTFKVNGREIARLRCDKPGPQQFRAPLPPELIPSVPSRDRQGAVADLVLQASIDKPWIAPADGKKLGVILTAMGFVQP